MFALLAIASTMITGSAYSYAPFEVSGNDIFVKSYELDYEVNSIIPPTDFLSNSNSSSLSFFSSFKRAPI